MRNYTLLELKFAKHTSLGKHYWIAAMRAVDPETSKHYKNLARQHYREARMIENYLLARS